MSAIGYEVGQAQLIIPTGALMSLHTPVPMMIIIFPVLICYSNLYVSFVQLAIYCTRGC